MATASVMVPRAVDPWCRALTPGRKSWGVRGESHLGRARPEDPRYRADGSKVSAETNDRVR